MTIQNTPTPTQTTVVGLCGGGGIWRRQRRLWQGLADEGVPAGYV